MQLQPHFLFNTLNGILSAIHQQKVAEASEMTTGLSELLRIALKENGRPIVSLSEELNYVQKYLSIDLLFFVYPMIHFLQFLLKSNLEKSWQKICSGRKP